MQTGARVATLGLILTGVVASWLSPWPVCVAAVVVGAGLLWIDRMCLDSAATPIAAATLFAVVGLAAAEPIWVPVRLGVLATLALGCAAVWRAGPAAGGRATRFLLIGGGVWVLGSLGWALAQPGPIPASTSRAAVDILLAAGLWWLLPRIYPVELPGPRRTFLRVAGIALLLPALVAGGRAAVADAALWRGLDALDGGERATALAAIERAAGLAADLRWAPLEGRVQRAQMRAYERWAPARGARLLKDIEGRARTWEDRHELAELQRLAGRPGRAVATYQTLLNRRAISGAQHDAVVTQIYACLALAGRQADLVDAVRRHKVLPAPKAVPAEALPALGDAALFLGADAAATSYLARLAEVDSDPVARYKLGVALQRQERHAEAVRALVAVLAARPDMADAHYRLARSREALDDTAGASAALAAAVRLDPRHVEALEALQRLGQATPAQQAQRGRLRPAVPVAGTDPGGLELLGFSGLPQQLDRAGGPLRLTAHWRLAPHAPAAVLAQGARTPKRVSLRLTGRSSAGATGNTRTLWTEIAAGRDDLAALQGVGQVLRSRVELSRHEPPQRWLEVATDRRRRIRGAPSEPPSGPCQLQALAADGDKRPLAVARVYVR